MPDVVDRLSSIADRLIQNSEDTNRQIKDVVIQLQRILSSDDERRFDVI